MHYSCVELQPVGDAWQTSLLVLGIGQDVLFKLVMGASAKNMAAITDKTQPGSHYCILIPFHDMPALPTDGPIVGYESL